jgi:aldehyde dehydrogenase (NAD+)
MEVVVAANNLKFYIDGAWVDPLVPCQRQVVNPATEETIGSISLGSAADVDRGVAAAKTAFRSYGQTSKAERIALFESIVDAYRPRIDDIADTVRSEMGAHAAFAHSFHAAASIDTMLRMVEILKTYEFARQHGTTLIMREPIGVCGLITPWNAPMASVVGKMTPALAAGCTVVVKPSEIAPLSPIILAEIMDRAGVPKGVFNLVNGEGATVGQRIAAHPDVDMVSFTGSTRAGVLVAKAAADSVKRVQQELGGKSANIILPDADVEKVVAAGLQRCYVGAGQSCQAPTRMLVHVSQQAKAMQVAKSAAEAFKVGDPRAADTTMGPLASRAQYEKVQLERGFYVRPTVFANVGRRMKIAQEEIFGPVLSILPYEDEEDAIAIANDTIYGLAGWVYSGDLDHARRVAMRLRTGRVYLNGAAADPAAPFGGYKHSGNGREGGIFGLEEYLEVKALLGSAVPAVA